MKKQTMTKGFGVAAAIIIIAILSIGGYTAVRYAQKNQTEMEMKQADMAMLTDSRTKIKLGLENLEKTLASNIGLDAKVKATTDIISDLKADITDAQGSLSTEASAQLEVLDDKLTQLSVEIKSNVETATETLEDIIDSIEVSLETEGEASMDDGTEDDGDTMTDDDSTTGDDSMMGDDNSATTSVEVNVDAQVDLNN